MKLKEYRLSHNMTQADAGKIIGKSGTGYSYYESGKNEPDIKSLILLADYYHITVDALIDHNIPYLLDKSLLSQEQNEIIDQIINLTREQCMLVSAYIEGLKIGQAKRDDVIRKIKGEQ